MSEVSHAAAHPRAQISVLVVDDHAICREGLAQLLDAAADIEDAGPEELLEVIRRAVTSYESFCR